MCQPRNWPSYETTEYTEAYENSLLSDPAMQPPQPISPNNIAPGIPLYKEVRRRILDALARGEWQPGERLPNEADLAQRFGVAVSTVRAGVSELTTAGVLVRQQGKGTYVARHDFERQQFRFSNIYDSERRKVVTTRHITAIARVRADNVTRDLLQLGGTRSSYVYRVSAILRIADEPAAIMNLLLPVDRFPGLRQKDLEQTSENLYSVYQRVCGVTVLRMEERIEAKTATDTLARKLRVHVGHPVLCVERIAFTFNDVPVEIRRRFYEGTKYHYLFVHDRLD